MKVKQIIAFIMSVLICLSSFNIPTFAVLPDNLTERTNEYTVIINSGDGTIKTNTDETVKSNQKLGREYTYIDAKPEDFICVSNIELTVREDETIKNRLDYSTTHSVEVGLATFSDIYKWHNEAFITSTRAANAVLCQGLNTDFSFSDGSLASDIRGIIYPQNVTKAYVFIPNDASLIYSHFIDQDGNVFNLDEPVTKNLILTPIYTSTAEDDSFFGKQIHQVTVLPGEGRLQRYIDDRDYFSKPHMQEEIAKDIHFEDIDSLTFVVKDGDTEFFDLTTPYSRLKYGNLELSEIFLQNGFSEVMKDIESSDGKEFIERFVNLVENSNTLWFTDGGIVNHMFTGGGLRENGYSLLFLLMGWTVFYGKDSTSLENLDYILTQFEKYDELTEDEKIELQKTTKDTLFAFKAEWDSFITAEIKNCGTDYMFISDAKYKGCVVNNIVFGDGYADKYIRLRTPVSENYYYVFSHFIDQDGNIFNFGDPVTKDLVLTPIYYDEWDPKAPTSVIGKVSVTTEDNSTDTFDFSMYRENMNLFSSVEYYNNTSPIEQSLLLSVFSKDELSEKIKKDEFIRRFSKYSLTEDDIVVDEDGCVKEYAPPIYQYLQNKASYSFNPEDWEIDNTGMITKYNGDFGLIGVPDSINGIQVNSINTSAFSELHNKYLDGYSGYYGESAIDYYSYYCAVWLPSTITQLNKGITDGALNTFISSLIQQAESEEEKDYILNLSQFLVVSTEGIDDCTPFAYLPHSYIVVDNDNPNYSSLSGSLYNKDKSELYYTSFITSFMTSHMYANTEQGVELPSSLHRVSAFANYNAWYSWYDGLFHLYNQDITFNSCCIFLTLDMLSMYDFYYTSGVQQGMNEEELTAYLEDTVGTASRDEATEMSNSILEHLALGNFFAGAGYLGVIASSANETDVTEAARTSLTALLRAYDPSMSDDDISAEVKYFVNRYILTEDSMIGKINRTGTVSNNNDYEATFLMWDEYVYSVSLNNLPNRYKPVDAQILVPSNKGKRQVTFNLELKRGNVRIVTRDIKDTTIMPNATYQILDSSGVEVATISSTSEDSQAVLDSLPYGTYTAVQTSVGAPYDTAPSQNFSIMDDGQVVDLEFLVDKTSIYSVKIPKYIVLDGITGTADIVISVKGKLLPTGRVTIKASSNISLAEQSIIDTKECIPVIMISSKTIWSSEDVHLETWSSSIWHIAAPLSAGRWKGLIPITIQIE